VECAVALRFCALPRDRGGRALRSVRVKLMPRTLEMRQHARVILTLRPDVSVYDGSAIYRVAQGPSGNSKEVMAICERLERAHRRGEWCTVDDLMEELRAFRIWLYEGDRY